jgi:predicted alpha/beta hydrolase
MRCFCGCQRKVPRGLRRLNRGAKDLGLAGDRLDKKVQSDEPRFVELRDEGLALQARAAGLIHDSVRTPVIAHLATEESDAMRAAMKLWAKTARKIILASQKEQIQGTQALGREVMARQKAEGLSREEAASAVLLDKIGELPLPDAEPQHRQRSDD